MKLLPTRVVTDQLKTLRDSRSTGKFKIAAGDYGWLYALPVAIGVTAWVFGTFNLPHRFGFKIAELPTANLLAGMAVLTGLVFNLSFSVFDKSLTIRNDPLMGNDPITVTLVEELRVNVNYTVLVGIFVTAILTSASVFVYNPLANITIGLIAFGISHMLLMCGMVLKRFNALHAAMKP